MAKAAQTTLLQLRCTKQDKRLFREAAKAAGLGTNMSAFVLQTARREAQKLKSAG